MPATKGTRRGNGAGHGGPARGEGKKGADQGQGRKLGVPLAETKAVIKRETFREILQAETRALAERWLQIAKDDNHAHQHTMILKAAEIQGEFKQSVELTGANGGALEIRRVIVDPKEAS